MALRTATPTQTMHDVIGDFGAGLADTDDLYAALHELEEHLGLPVTNTKDAA